MTPKEAIAKLERLQEPEPWEPQIDSEMWQALEMGIEALKKQEWISSRDRLPDDRNWYLGIFREHDTGWVSSIPYVCDYVGRETPITTRDYWILKDCDDGNPYYKNLECVAWMPLPEYDEV